MAYRSTELRLREEDDSCPICRFLAGDHATENLLEVIRRLDVALAQEQEMIKLLLEACSRLRKREGPPKCAVAKKND